MVVDLIEGYGDDCTVVDPDEEQDVMEWIVTFQVPGYRPILRHQEAHRRSQATVGVLR